jgi:DNA invertase Pin-like site-specific DNA recombinase
MQKNAVYIRVSTTDQNVESQQKEIQRWLDGNEIGIAEWYVDRSTGKNLDRPAFERLQRDIFDGQVKTVIVWKLDRLSRSLRDGINVLADWCDRGVRVVATSQMIDFTSGSGKMVASTLLAVAEMENELRKERQAAGIAVAKAKGIYTGRKKGTTKGKPSRAKILHEKGLLPDEIAQAMGVSRSTVFRYLK